MHTQAVFNEGMTKSLGNKENGAYAFQHLSLQEYFAEMPDDSPK
jgi:hypothetical protein